MAMPKAGREAMMREFQDAAMTMLHIDPAIPATVLTLSRSKTVTTHIRETSLREAVRFVMERLPKVERSRSLIRTATHSLYFAEIEALYMQPEFLDQNPGLPAAPE
jgi:hypothetical protein